MYKKAIVLSLTFALFTSAIFSMESDGGGAGGSPRKSVPIQGLQAQLSQQGGALTGGASQDSGTGGHGVGVSSGFDVKAGEAYLKAEVSRRVAGERTDDLFKPIEDKARAAGELGALELLKSHRPSKTVYGESGRASQYPIITYTQPITSDLAAQIQEFLECEKKEARQVKLALYHS